jgi:hypothetical protein
MSRFPLLLPHVWVRGGCLGCPYGGGVCRMLMSGMWVGVSD